MTNNLLTCHKTTFAVILILSLCLLSACQFSGGGNTNTENNRETNKNIPPVSERSAGGEDSTTASNSSVGPCANKYFPIADGNTRRYSTQQSGARPIETSYQQSYQAGADSFSETQKILNGKNTTVKVDWTCLPEGLRTATYGQFQMSNKIGMNLETKKAHGITLPKDADWTVGEKWISEYDIGGQFDSKIVKGAVSGKVTMNHEIVAMDEMVKVPAGEFAAARVKVDVVLNLYFQGKKLPTEDFTMTNWHSPDVGLVKQVVTGFMGTSTLEYLGK